VTAPRQSIGYITRAFARFPEGANAYFELLKAEALFGVSELEAYWHETAHCLEIGAGPGLLALLAAEYGVAHVDSVEPIAAGFSISEPILKEVMASGLPNLSVHRNGIEDFRPAMQYDIIWAVNVFEHLPDWRGALLKTRSMLAPGGKAILLFPNYDIPYEPHFKLPLIGGRSFARRVLGAQIERQEADYGESGLWDSLNFIKASELIRFAWKEGIHLSIDKTITVRMFERLRDDAELKARQGILSLPAALFRFLRLHRLWASLPAITQPYLRVVISAGTQAVTSGDASP
jgi:SAM-dependent methyltransferase